MRELTLNYDNTRKHADGIMKMNYELEKIFASKMKIAMGKVSCIPSIYNDATNRISEIKRVNVDQENKLKFFIAEKVEIERQHTGIRQTEVDEKVEAQCRSYGRKRNHISGTNYRTDYKGGQICIRFKG